MEIEVLQKPDFANDTRNEATVTFTYRGAVIFNHRAVVFLNLLLGGKKGYNSVYICRDLKCKSDFGVFVDADGWKLRPHMDSGAVFNCVGLARHVIDATWDRQGACHGVGVEKPRRMVFRVARKPWDDDKNRDVYALLRRKND